MKFSNIGWSKMNQNTKVFLVITILFFSIYSFASDGHRSTSDEDFAQQQALRIVLQEPDPEFVLGESGNFFKYPEFWYPHGQGPICNYGILCYPAGLVYSFTEVPFVFLNHHLNFITTESVVFTVDDFPDAHYVMWRNSAEPSITFMELFYSPLFSSLSASLFQYNCQSQRISSPSLRAHLSCHRYSCRSLAGCFLLLSYVTPYLTKEQ